MGLQRQKKKKKNEKKKPDFVSGIQKMKSYIYQQSQW